MLDDKPNFPAMNVAELIFLRSLQKVVLNFYEILEMSNKWNLINSKLMNRCNIPHYFQDFYIFYKGKIKPWTFFYHII